MLDILHIMQSSVIVAIWGVLSAFELKIASPLLRRKMGGAFESFESDLSRAHTHFRIWGHLDGSNFENDVFAPPPRCHVLVNRAAPPPPSLQKSAVLVLLLLATPQIFFQLEYPRERFRTPGTSAAPRPRK